MHGRPSPVHSCARHACLSCAHTAGTTNCTDTNVQLPPTFETGQHLERALEAQIVLLVVVVRVRVHCPEEAVAEHVQLFGTEESGCVGQSESFRKGGEAR